MEKVSPLSISHIREWLHDNRNEYQKLTAQEFPPLENEAYWTYNYLHDFIRYCEYVPECHKALQDLKPFINFNFPEIIKWTKTHEALGSQHLLMFEVSYFDWKEDVKEGLIKIHEGLYTERKPFINLICFCKIFQLLYWDNDITGANVPEQEQFEIREELQNIYDKYFVDSEHE